MNLGLSKGAISNALCESLGAQEPLVHTPEMVKQEGWGVKPKDLAHTLFVYFGFLGTDGGPANFELLIDDVRLY